MLNTLRSSCTQQRDDHSCGAHVLLHAEAVMRNVHPLALKNDILGAEGYRRHVLHRLCEASEYYASQYAHY